MLEEVWKGIVHFHLVVDTMLNTSGIQLRGKRKLRTKAVSTERKMFVREQNLGQFEYVEHEIFDGALSGETKQENSLLSSSESTSIIYASNRYWPNWSWNIHWESAYKLISSDTRNNLTFVRFWRLLYFYYYIL